MLKSKLLYAWTHILCNCLTDITFALRARQCGSERFPRPAQRNLPACIREMGCSVLEHRVSTRLFVCTNLNNITWMLSMLNFGFTLEKTQPTLVLLVLLDQQQCDSIESALRSVGFEVSIALERKNAVKLMNEENPQLIIVDSALPAFDDILLCKRIRTELNMPQTGVISLSEPQSGPDIQPAPDIGIDANLKKPFAMQELLAKIAELQSHHPAKKDRHVLTAGAIKMVPEHWLVYVEDESVNLTEKEYRLLQELMEVGGKVLTRETLLERVWGHQKALKLETRTLDVHMSRLRTKLGASAANIITVRNVGYRMNVISKLLSHAEPLARV